MDGQFTLNGPDAQVIWKAESVTNGNGVDYAAMLDADPTNNYSACKQDKVQKCELGGLKPEELYESYEAPHATWPAFSNYDQFPSSSESDCARSCFKNCNCVVTIFRDGTCYKKKLPLAHGKVDLNMPGTALVKAEISRWREEICPATLTLVILVSLDTSVFLNFLFVATISALVFCSNPKKKKLSRLSSILETNLQSFTYEDLREATGGFREELGKGFFGTVYKGVISSSSSSNIVAVKKLDKLAQQGEKEFRTEVSAIAKSHHKNLVRLLGFCDEGPHGILVSEFMSNGTLASFIFGILKPDWNKRIQMAFGIAKGPMYWHEECSTQIIHCDIKPQNILLDESFTPRISDFGLAKLLIHTAIRRTRGYVAPEWFRSKPITAKVDVYSYRVMLSEIICCRKHVEDERENQEEIILTDWVYDC
ncbi:hypothetical protein F0562_018670 [Nyssa sinensis]|uniref:non-specific serine/threonine protein kinase n=1 Tax=Nyssa sinensis TaxID=561372 RepID=A0A5J4ZCS3_9ASTE|nr:hypothetical protein F0562_018670 [Nyssa sinensis]